jgi:hypothetical protein
MIQKIELRKVRDFSAKVNITFEFIRQNFKALAKSIVFISGPFIFLQGIFLGLYQQKTLDFGQLRAGLFGEFAAEVGAWLGLGLLFAAASYVSSLIVVNEFVRLYEQREDPSTIEVSEIWEGVKANFLRMTGAGILFVIIVMVGFILLIIPGVYLAVTLSLLAPIMLLEQKNLGEAMSRSFKLITEKWWSTFGLLIVMSLIVSFMGFVFQIPQTVLTMIIAFHKVSDVNATPPLWQQASLVASTLISTFGSNLLQAIIFLAMIFQFYNLVERQEAQGLLNKLESFGKTDANAPKHDETY